MNRKLKILQITASLKIGGAERLILDLTQYIDQENFEVHVCVIGSFDHESLLSDFKNLNVPLHIIHANHFHDPRTLLSVKRYIQENKIDLVHTHLTDGDIVGRIAGWLTGTPVVSTLHNIPGSYDQQRFDRRWLSRMTAQYFATHLVAVSNHIGELFIQQWRIPKHQISTIYNATKTECFFSDVKNTPPKIPSSKLIVTNIASLTPQKGQHLLLLAAKEILKLRPKTEFMLVGDGALKLSLQQQAVDLGIDGNVTFTGIRRDIPQILAQTDVFVLSSLWEGMPVSAIEAMAASKPVVLTNVGGNSELVDHDHHGLLIPPNDVVALTDAILTLLDDEHLRNKLGNAARSRVLQEFNVDTFINFHESLYQEIVKKSLARTK